MTPICQGFNYIFVTNELGIFSRDSGQGAIWAKQFCGIEIDLRHRGISSNF